MKIKTEHEKQISAAYTRGYQAGRRSGSVERTQEEFKRDVFLTVLPEIIRTGTWTQGGKKASTPEVYSSIAAYFAQKAVEELKRC